MLVKLLPEQVSREWEVISYMIRESLPPIIVGSSDESMNNILMSIMSGRLDCWASYDKETKEINGFVTTMVVVDFASKIKSLLIYSVFTVRDTDKNTWKEGSITLSKHAKSKGCSNLIAYTNMESIVKFVDRIGGDTSYTFISIPL